MVAPSDSLTVVSHNVYWFQGQPSRWGAERQQAHPEILLRLAILYAWLKPNLLCLQEVPGPDAAAELADRLGMQYHYRSGSRRPAYGGAILWRDLTLEIDDLTRRGDTPPFERFCLVARLAWRDRPFTLVNLHLSSNRFLPAGQGEAARLAELGALFEAAPDPDLLVGDFNAEPESGVYHFLQRQGLRDAGAASPEETTVDGRRIDYAWLAARRATDLVSYRVTSGRAVNLSGQTNLSDHFPLVVTLN